MEVLGLPQVASCYLDKTFPLTMSAMRLQWPVESAAEQCWRLPQGITLTSPPPERFGLTIKRGAADAFAVRLLWNDQLLQWHQVSRRQILTSCLAPLLRALGTDVWRLLEQPVAENQTQAA